MIEDFRAEQAADTQNTNDFAAYMADMFERADAEAKEDKKRRDNERAQAEADGWALVDRLRRLGT